MDNKVLLYAVGDVAPSRADPDSLFVNVSPLLNQADIAFCQLEICITNRGSRLPQVRHTDRTDVKAAQAIRNAGFNVVSFAGNHCMDWGQEGFFDTINALRDKEIATVGVGTDIRAAREPVIINSKGQRIAFLAYNTILPMCYWAEDSRPGCAPMRAWTYYEQIEHDQPGTPCRIHTFANRADLAALQEDIRKAKQRADVVFVSLHWGIHFVPAVIADYQPDVAHAAIDAGADAIFGHHAHILKGFEVYKGKPVFYSLCNFAVDLPMDKQHAESASFKEIQSLHPGWEPDFTSTYNFPPESRRTVITKCIIYDGKLQRVSLLPTYVNCQSQPKVLKRSDEQFQEVADYLKEVNAAAGLNGKFEAHEDELLITLA